MSWVSRLFARLPHIWSRDPIAVPVFSFGCNGTGLTWAVADGVLSLNPTGGTATALSIPLANYPTLALLANFIAGQPGYTLTGIDPAGLPPVSPLAFVEGQGDASSYAGSIVYRATSDQYLILGAAGEQLAAAGAQIPLLVAQMSTTTAKGSWLDMLGGFFNVPRVAVGPAPETDMQYGLRIISETIRPKCNNKAMELALLDYTGIVATVLDVQNAPGARFLDGSFNLDGSHVLDGAGITPVGGLFDVYAGYALIGDNAIFSAAIVLTAYINRLKAGGTQLRNLILAPLSDLLDVALAPIEVTDNLLVTYAAYLDGTMLLDGTWALEGAQTVGSTMSGVPRV